MKYYLAFAIGMAVWAIISTFAHAHIEGHPEWDTWMAEQKTPDHRQYSCCNKTDAYILEDYQVRIRDGQYEVLTFDGRWLRFENTGQGNPGNTVLGAVQNPTGHAVAWYIGLQAFCFAEGSGT